MNPTQTSLVFSLIHSLLSCSPVIVCQPLLSLFLFFLLRPSCVALPLPVSVSPPFPFACSKMFLKSYIWTLFNKCELQPCSTYIFLSSSSCFLFLSSSSLLFLSSSICSCIFLSRSCSSSTFCFSTRCSTSFSCLFKLLTSPKYSVSIASRFIKLPCRKQIYFSFKHNQSKKKKLTSLCHFRD